MQRGSSTHVFENFVLHGKQSSYATFGIGFAKLREQIPPIQFRIAPSSVFPPGEDFDCADASGAAGGGNAPSRNLEGLG